MLCHWLALALKLNDLATKEYSIGCVIILYICTLTFCSFWAPQNSKLLLPSAATSSTNCAAPLPLEIIHAHTRSVTLFLCSSFYLLCSLSCLILARATVAFEIPQWGSIKYYLNTASTMFDRWHMLWFKSCSFLLWFFNLALLFMSYTSGWCDSSVFTFTKVSPGFTRTVISLPPWLMSSRIFLHQG